jgi:hypothetical protein
MSKRSFRLLVACLAGLIVSLGCALPTGLAPIASSENLARTAAAHTVEAVMTQLAADATPTPLQFIPTEAPPTATPIPSPTDTPTPAPTPTPSATSAPCNRASFQTDVTIPDRSVFKPGEDFTKTWRLRNQGSCTWTTGYALVFDTGDRMSGPRTQALRGAVGPGETVDISVKLEAPESRGDYKGYWKLQADDGRLFGIGDEGTKPFWVDIRVSVPAKTVYSLVDNYCDAEWSTASGSLPCPGEAGSPDGFAVLLKEAVMEGGRKENEPGLWTHPEAVEDGRIRGEFPAFKVEDGDVFRAVISCLDNAPSCSVRMRLQYRIGDGSIKTLAEWNEKTDGKYRKVEVDLSELAGKKVKFILTVGTRGDYEDDAAFWLMPRIMR